MPEVLSYVRQDWPPRVAKDRRGWLILFGVLFLLLAALAWLAVAGMMLILLVVFPGPEGGTNSAGSLDDLLAVAVGIGGAIFLTWVGVDTIRCRRWVRPILLAFGWLTLIGSLFMLAGWMLLIGELTTIFDLPPNAPAMKRLQRIGAIAGCLTFLAGVLVPLVVVWFFGATAVRDTLQAYDPSPSWTEKCPVPVFVGSAALLLASVGTLALSTVGSVPLFGAYLTGPPASALVAMAALALLVAAILSFCRQIAGWWLSLAMIVGGFSSAIVTFCRLGMMEFYRQGGLSKGDLSAIENTRVLSGSAPISFCIAAALICVFHLLATRHYYIKRPSTIGA